jgi:hypothetical protein
MSKTDQFAQFAFLAISVEALIEIQPIDKGFDKGCDGGFPEHPSWDGS